MKFFTVTGLIVWSFLAGIAFQMHVSHAWKVHTITGVSLYQILTGGK